ncbi:Uncharacterized membrane protein [Mesobacillus persicus]|uniref:Uncharacterized membrane protein n=1 Tax=Mesobacillus persicus TaxID=930146 RepID=A0A1H8CPB9_9BACI|nr:DUF2157 domain-containing protein [Mesobacillus persicus]SEM97003.1 Uncharacterized membrane protein [Mesobacillus persicus]
MSKRRIKLSEWQLLKREMKFLEETGVLDPGKTKEIEGLYEEERVSFTKTLLYVGSVLIGIGVLSFVASNWSEIGKLTKFLLIIGLFIACNFTGLRMEKSFPKTAKSLYYLGVIVFGAGIFLVGQMFHFGGDFQDAFLWWSLGILPLAWVLRDKWILLGSSILILIYMTDESIISGQMVPYWILFWIAILYFLNDKIGFSQATGVANSLLSLAFIASILKFSLDGIANNEYIYGLIYFVIGLGLVQMSGKVREIHVILGYFIHGGAALLLSFEESWPVGWIFLVFSILYLIYLLYQINKGSLLSIVILCLMIFRFYLDYTFDFLPKSLVFIIGGLLLLTFGIYFERQRKKGGNRLV